MSRNPVWDWPWAAVRPEDGPTSASSVPWSDSASSRIWWLAAPSAALSAPPMPLVNWTSWRAGCAASAACRSWGCSILPSPAACFAVTRYLASPPAIWGSRHRKPAAALACVAATELDTGREIWLQEGPLRQCVRASCGMPGLLTPTRVEDRWLVDGAVVNPVPISLARAMGAEVVIAVNLNTDMHQPWTDEPDEPVQGAAQPVVEPGRARTQYPRHVGVMTGSINIMQERITRARMAGDPPRSSSARALATSPSWISTARATPSTRGSLCRAQPGAAQGGAVTTLPDMKAYRGKDKKSANRRFLFRATRLRTAPAP